MRIASPKAVRKRLQEYSQQETFPPISNGDRGAVVGAFEEVLEGATGAVKETNQKRYIVWGFCFCPEDHPIHPMQSEMLSDAQFFALKRWIGFYKDDEDNWQRRRAFHYECRQILSLADGILFAENASSSPQAFRDWLDMLDEAVIELEHDDMVASTIGDLGGVVTSDSEEEPFYGKPSTPAPQPKPEVEYQPEEGWVPL